MASHAAMLLNPKGSKRQGQSNGNPPFSTSPASDLPPMDAVDMLCEVASDNSEPMTDSTALPSPDSPDSPDSPGYSSHAPSLPCVDTMDTSATPRDLLDAPEALVHLDTQMDTQDMCTEMLHPAESCVVSAPQMDTSVIHAKSLGPSDSPLCAPNSLDPSSSLSSHDSYSLVTSPPADPMLLDPTDSQGLLLEGLGKKQGNGSSPASPMAPTGTADAARFYEPTIHTSPSVPSGISTPAVKSEPSLAVQFSTTHDEDNESDTKRSHHEMSDDEDIIHRPNLIEDIYGVEKRKNQPTKKIKTEHDVEEKPNMATAPVSISGDSGLGKWMKEEDVKPTPISTTPSVVDLTAGMGWLTSPVSPDFVLN